MNRVMFMSMRLLVPCLALLWIGMLSAATQGKVTGARFAEFPDWFKESFLDIQEDAGEAAVEGKHVILFMHLAGCPYCYRMVEENFKHAPYTDYIKEHFDAIEINIKGDREIAFDDNTRVTEKELAKLLKVRYTPTIIFLNGDNKPVLRLNGYRSVEAFGHALRYVNEKAYQQTTLSRYIEQQGAPRYVLRDHPSFQAVHDLSQVQGPLLVLFEDRHCDACDELHDGHLKNPQIVSVLKNYTVVRLDASSDRSITDPKGNRTTSRAFAERLGLSYRPGILLYDRGREISRIDGLLYTYHFTEMLRYVGERHYERYPDSFYDYLGVRTRQLLDQGITVDLSE